MSSCLKRAIAHALAATALVACAAGTATAATVTADLTKVGGNTWDASFTVEADVGQTVEAFSIYFDWTQVSNLVVWASPADWDSLAIQADVALASDGLFDTLVMAAGITGRSSLNGFTARFDWADPVGPSALRFTINDPVTFEELERGSALLTFDGGGGTSLPEPVTGALVALGLFAAAAAGRGPKQT